MSTTAEVEQVIGLSLSAVLAAGLPAQVAALEALVDAITSGSTSRPDDVEATVLADASVRTRRAMERLEAERLGWLCAVDVDGRWAVEAFRSFAQWVAWSHGSSVATARREVMLARALRDDLPATAEAARAGVIGSDHVRIMATVAATTERRRLALAGAGPGGREGAAHPSTEDSDDGRLDPDATPRAELGSPVPTGEDVLVGLAASHRPEAFRQVAQHFAALADPEASDRAFADAAEREFLDLSATLGGFHVAGFLTNEHGQALSTALSAVIGVPSAGDVRTPGRRRAQGLADLARLTLDHGLAGSGAAVRPHLTVTVSVTELTSALAGGGAGEVVVPDGRARPDGVTDGPTIDWAALVEGAPARWVDGTGPVPAAVLRRLACDGEISRVVFGPDSQILNVGRRERTVSGAKRRAVIARDKQCVWPSCHAPPPQCEVHHAVTHWADGGDTSTDNAALLCWFHHDYVDTHHIAMSYAAGAWTFQRPDGRAIPATVAA